MKRTTHQAVLTHDTVLEGWPLRHPLEPGSAILFEAPNVLSALDGFFEAALDVYFAADPAPGCFVMCTAPSLALTHPEVRADAKAVIDEIDDILEKRFALAQREGELPESFAAWSAARLTQAVLHSLALRARAGEERSVLSSMAHEATRTITGEKSASSKEKK